MHELATGPLTRRSLLGGVAGASVALGTGALTAETEAAVLAGTRQGALPKKVDVVVVGAGIAGLDDEDVVPTAGDLAGGDQARDAGADHDDVDLLGE